MAQCEGANCGDDNITFCPRHLKIVFKVEGGAVDYDLEGNFFHVRSMLPNEISLSEFPQHLLREFEKQLPHRYPPIGEDENLLRNIVESARSAMHARPYWEMGEENT